MSYQRFVLPGRLAAQVRPATVATSATLQATAARTVAGLASLAGRRRRSEVDGEVVQARDQEVAGCASKSDGDGSASRAGLAHGTPATFANLATVAAPAHLVKPEFCPVTKPDPLRCLVCDQRLTIDDAIVALLSGTPHQPFWLHHRCHDEHIRRCLAVRDQIPFSEPERVQ